MALRQWIHELGVETFVGSSGRVFPLDMKAAPLLRAWLKRLREAGVTFHMRHRFVALENNRLHFQHDSETIEVNADATVLAMGGASWPKLGSDGAWQETLAKNNVTLQPLQSANCGFFSHWSEHLQQKHAGSPLKNIAFGYTFANGETVTKKGEAIVSRDGMEGSLIYAFSKYLRDSINATGTAQLSIDLLPEKSLAQIEKKLHSKQGKDSFGKYLKRTLGISGIKGALLYEYGEKPQLKTPAELAWQLKNIAVTFYQAKPIAEAISSAGGVCESSVDKKLMLTALPGIFCAGEMLDWEAPTGGYLLTACFATGRLAALGVCEYLAQS